MDQISVIAAGALDLDEYARLQRDAYAELLAENGVDSHIQPAYYDWKYRTSSGAATVALARSGGDLVAANAMFPMCVSDGARRMLVWQSCDTATHASARGRGLFSKCIRALHESLPPETVFLGFPNRNSIRGFEKLGWTPQATVATFGRFLTGRGADPCGDQSFRPLRSEDAPVDELAGAVCASAPSFMKDSAYLTRRYLEHSVHRYAAFVLTDDRAASVARGVVVLRRTSVRGREIVVVMEAVGRDPADVRRLLALAGAWGSSHGAKLAVGMGTTLRPLDALRAGYVRVPGFVLPKRHVLMGAANGPSAERLWKRSWSVQLGDWDAF